MPQSQTAAAARQLEQTTSFPSDLPPLLSDLQPLHTSFCMGINSRDSPQNLAMHHGYAVRGEPVTECPNDFDQGYDGSAFPEEQLPQVDTNASHFNGSTATPAGPTDDMSCEHLATAFFLGPQAAQLSDGSNATGSTGITSLTGSGFEQRANIWDGNQGLQMSDDWGLEKVESDTAAATVGDYTAVDPDAALDYDWPGMRSANDIEDGAAAPGSGQTQICS